MYRKTYAGALLSACLALSATAARAAERVHVYDKLGVSADQALADEQACSTRAARISVGSGSIVSATVFGGLGAGLAIGVMNSMRRGEDMRQAVSFCMIGRGYAHLELTPDEGASLRKAGSGQAKRAWLSAFLAQDLSARIAQALAGQPHLAPQLGDEPFAIEGVRFDPAALKLVEGAGRSGQPLLTGVMSHRQTAVLNDDLEGKAGLVRVAMKSGAVVYAVDAAGTSSSEQSTLWCGPATAYLFGGAHASAACLLSTLHGDALLPAGGGDWMMSPDMIPHQIKAMPITSGTLDLTLSPTDQIGPMSFTLQCVYVDQDQLKLRAVAERDGKKVEFWSGVEPFDASGRAVLPLWSKRLVMTRRYDKGRDSYTVQASLSDDGSGADWLDPAPPTTGAPATGAPVTGPQTPTSAPRPG